MTEDKKQRIMLATSCKDCDYIEKVDKAGQILSDLKGKEFQIMHNGIMTYIDSHYGDFNVEIIKNLKGHHEPQEEKVFNEILKLLKPGSSMIELGAFWGYYSLWFKSAIENSEVYLVEPMDTMLEYGRRNFDLNECSGNFFQYAIGDKNAENISFKHWDGKDYEINQICVDSFLEINKIEHCEILHADIQGFELEMLKGAYNSLKSKSISFVFISTHSNLLHYKCLGHLRKLGYKIVAEHNISESFASDGLIVASADSRIDKIKISKKRNFISWIKKIKYLKYL
jgi:FkbM family methyltransferase